MFEDFSFCTECEHYDQNDRLCKLFQCARVNGCQCGEERKPRNRFERFKAMSLEELADYYGAETGQRTEDVIRWLKEEVDGKAD